MPRKVKIDIQGTTTLNSATTKEDEQKLIDNALEKKGLRRPFTAVLADSKAMPSNPRDSDRPVTTMTANQKKKATKSSPSSRAKSGVVRISSDLDTSVELNTEIDFSSLTREQRAEAVTQRRERLERERAKAILISSKSLTEGNEENLRRKRLVDLMVYVVFGSRVGAMLDKLLIHQAEIRRYELEKRSAQIILRVMRLNQIRRHRERVLRYISMISPLLVLRLGRWRLIRKRNSCKIILAFLNVLRHENSITNGCLSMISKGKKWIAYKHKIVVLQRFWRKTKLLLEAQDAFLDRLWQKENQRLISLEVDNEFRRSEERVAKRNREINTINGTRQRNMRRLLNLERPDTREKIRERLLLSRERDILTPQRGDGIANIHIRLNVIREFIRNFKRIYVAELMEFERHKERIRSEMKLRRTAEKKKLAPKGFMNQILPLECMTPTKPTLKSYYETDDITLKETQINESQNDEISEFSSSSLPLTTKKPFSLYPKACPQVPLFRLMLGKETLSKLLDLTDVYISKVRLAWSPTKLAYEMPKYKDIGEEVARMHYASLKQTIKEIT